MLDHKRAAYMQDLITRYQSPRVDSDQKTATNVWQFQGLSRKLLQKDLSHQQAPNFGTATWSILRNQKTQTPSDIYLRPIHLDMHFYKL